MEHQEIIGLLLNIQERLHAIEEHLGIAHEKEPATLNFTVSTPVYSQEQVKQLAMQINQELGRYARMRGGLTHSQEAS